MIELFENIKNSETKVRELEERKNELSPIRCTDKTQVTHYNNYQVALSAHSDTGNKIIKNNNNTFDYNNLKEKIQKCINKCLNLREDINNKDYDYNEFTEKFKQAYKNFIIFGKNGSGKSSLLKTILEFNLGDIIIVPANRYCKINKDSYFKAYHDYPLNQILADKNALIYLVREFNKKLADSSKDGNKKNDNIKEKLYNIFSSLNLERKVFLRKEFMYLYGDGINLYNIENASDGECAILYLIMVTLIAPLNSVLFIDEPERHLDSSMIKKLFDSLEHVRPDIIFVYVTNNIEFVNSRKNIDIIYLKKTKIYKNWNITNLKSCKDISLDVLLNIENSNNPIILCEGNNESIAFKILKCLYPDNKIIPVGSIEKVESNTKGLIELLEINAKGIITNGYMSNEKLDSLKKENIFTIGYNEWENFLLHSKILEIVVKSLIRMDYDKIKIDIIDYIKNAGRKDILDDFIKNIRNKKYNSNLSYDDFEEKIDKLNEDNKNLMVLEVGKLNELIDKENDYDTLVSIVPAKILLNKVSSYLDFSSSSKYVSLLIQLLNKSSKYKKIVKELLNLPL